MANSSNAKAVRIPKQGLIPSMFFYTTIAMILTQLAGVISTMIDGLITSRALGEDAYSSISLLGPFVSMLLLIAGFISTGNQIVCSRHLGRGEKEEANTVFSVSCLTILLASAALVAMCIFAPRFLISICGVSMNRKPELYPMMDRYIYGFLFGIPALLMVQLISPVLVMDGSRKLLPISSAVLCGVNITGDLISVHLLNAGTFGIGLSTSIATYAQLLILLTHFIRKKGVFRLSPRFRQIFRLLEVGKAGYPSLVRRAAAVLRDLCEAFDPVQWWSLHSGSGSQDTIGIRLVLGLAKEIRYFNAFQSNNVIIYLNRGN